MATKTVEVLTDDLDDGMADEPVRFAYRGMSYEIDLSTNNVASFDKAIAPYIAAARKERSRRARPSHNGRLAKAVPAAGAAATRDLAAIRTWAKKHGHTVAPKGRIAAHVVEAFDKAHRKPT
jgi:hypothetical protein